jgi:carbon monoxide dehydrogenase subunit G
MGIKLENTFAVDAPVDDTWRLLVDVSRMVPCMPGAELAERLDERRFRATVRLKVGPVDLKFAGEGELHDVDDAAHLAKLRAKGRDGKGRGSFQADMQFELTPQGAGSLVRVDTDLTLTGSVAQYGRGAGIVKEIAGQLTAQFARNLSLLVARSPGEASAVRPVHEVGAAPGQVEPISLFSLLFLSLKAAVRRWFGARSKTE